MKTRFLTGLAVGAMLLIGQPVFAYSHKAAAAHPVAHHAVAHRTVAVHRSVSHVRVAAVHRTPARTAIASRRSFAKPTTGYTANINRTRNGARNSVAFSGNANYAANSGHGKNFHGTYAFASHSGWNHGQQYNWHGHHYGWYGNGWYIIDPFPYGYGYWGPNTGYYNGSGAPVSIEVQTVLQQQGYYEGPIDGVVGPGTQAAIAAYQQANGLRVTGTITRGLLVDLGVG